MREAQEIFTTHQGFLHAIHSSTQSSNTMRKLFLPSPSSVRKLDAKQKYTYTTMMTLLRTCMQSSPEEKQNLPATDFSPQTVQETSFSDLSMETGPSQIVTREGLIVESPRKSKCFRSQAAMRISRCHQHPTPLSQKLLTPFTTQRIKGAAP